MEDSTNMDERGPLLPQPKRNPEPEAACFTLLVILSILFLLCSLCYFIYPGPSHAVDYKSLYRGAQAQMRRLTAENLALRNEVTLYKHMYEDVRGRAEHLEQANAVLEGEIRRLTAESLALGNEVAFYKHMYEDIRAQAEHLEQSNAVLEGEIHDLQTKLHDLRGDLTNAKVLAFWEIARTMNTNMCVPLSPRLLC
jgi:predicted nuclease with TOPRIM domain